MLQHHHAWQKHSSSQQPKKCSQPQHILSSSHVKPFQLQQSPPQLADGTKAAQPAPATTPELSPNEFNAEDWISSKVLTHSHSSAEPSSDPDEGLSGGSERPWEGQSFGKTIASGLRGDNKETDRLSGGQYANRAAFGGTISKPCSLQGDNSETKRSSGGQ